MTTSGETPATTNGAPPDAPERIGQWLGLLLGGFVGAFAFLGIEGEEVGVILRNGTWEPSVVALLVALALGASIGSVFLAKVTVPRRAALWFLVGVAGLAPLMTSLIPTPATTETANTAAGILGTALTVGAFVEVRRVLRSPEADDDGAPWPLQAVLLLAGVLLLGVAVYGGLRLETRSQYATTSPQVTATFERGEHADTMTLAMEAERLRAGDRMAVAVRGLLRGVEPEKECTRRADREDCTTSPCAHLPASCRFVAGAQLQPDAFGNVKERIDFVVDSKKYGHLGVLARVCTHDRRSQCQFRDTTLDIRLPPA